MARRGDGIYLRVTRTVLFVLAAIRNLPQPPWYQAERFKTLAAVSFKSQLAMITPTTPSPRATRTMTAHGSHGGGDCSHTSGSERSRRHFTGGPDAGCASTRRPG
jgi:hypothetical protein